MDETRFDDLLRSLIAARSRRGLGRALAGLTFGGVIASVLGLDDAEAKKGKKKRRGRNSPPPPPTPADPGAPPPTCTDGIKNGSETGVDCGGGTCQACTNDASCGNAACICT